MYKILLSLTSQVMILLIVAIFRMDFLLIIFIYYTFENIKFMFTIILLVTHVSLYIKLIVS